MKRSVGLNFLPKAISFSELGEDQVNAIAEKEEEKGALEVTLLQMLYSLNSDKERCVLFFELLRELGYNFDYESASHSLHIEWRWYMRIKKKIKERLSKAL
jgi:hypothetical protein